MTYEHVPRHGDETTFACNLIAVANRRIEMWQEDVKVGRHRLDDLGRGGQGPVEHDIYRARHKLLDSLRARRVMSAL